MRGKWENKIVTKYKKYRKGFSSAKDHLRSSLNRSIVIRQNMSDVTASKCILQYFSTRSLRLCYYFPYRRTRC